MKVKIRATPRTFGLAAALAAAGLFAAACGGGTYSGANGSSGTTAAPPAAPTHLTDSNGDTIYLFAADHDGQSVCTATCASYWPPVKAGTQLTGPAQGSLGSITRQDGSKQETLGGHPLYRYSGDHSPGQTNGQGLNLSGGLWWMVSPSGVAITNAAAPSTAPSGTGGYSGGGYTGGGYG
ncbi:COG4315 family predicted lipoprotein [Amycolatopsis sp. NPDC003676]